MALGVTGCNRHPQVEFKNTRLIAMLRTACNTKNATRLDQTAKEINAAREKGDLAEEHHAAFARIVAQAREGKWKEAEQACVQFQQAQVRY